MLNSNFNNKFNYSLSWETDNKDVCAGYYIYIYNSKGNVCEGGNDRDNDEDNSSNQEEDAKEDDSNNKDYEPSIQSE